MAETRRDVQYVLFTIAIYRLRETTALSITQIKKNSVFIMRYKLNYIRYTKLRNEEKRVIECVSAIANRRSISTGWFIGNGFVGILSARF